MKRLNITLAGIYVALTMAAAPVSERQAQLSARQFMNERGKSLSLQLAKKQLVQSSNVNGQQTAAYYVFNMGQQQGFVIVSGDDRTPAILGYSTEGAFSEENMPTNMQAWLDEYARQVRWMQKHHVQSTPAKAPVRHAISPMLTSLWDQGDPFNRDCPSFLNTGNQCATGCVATAMAQVLYYHGSNTGLPTGTTRLIPAYECNTNWGGFGKIKVSAKPTTTFAWADMLPSYANKTDNSYRTQCAAVAKLMAYCGAAVEMEYRDQVNGGSSASTNSISYALNTYFGMDAARASRETYSYPLWMELIYDELNAGRPVIYDGQSSSGGHSFVVDGYDGDELFHINWGWGGLNNGYFALDACNPGDKSGIGAGSSDDGYSYDQNAIIGIQPTTGITHLLNQQLTFTRLFCYANQIVCACYNRTDKDNVFDIGLAYVDENDNIIDDVFVLNENVELKRGYGLTRLLLTIENGTKPAGTYKMVGVSKLHNSDTWMVANTSRIFVTVVFDSEGSVTLVSHPTAGISASAVSINGSKVANEKQTVNVTLVNASDEYYGQIYLFASNNNQMGVAVSSTGVTLAKESTTTAQLSFTPNTVGTWHVWVATDSEGADIIGEAEAVITNSVYQYTDFIISNITFQNADLSSQYTDSDGRIHLDVLSHDVIVTPTVSNHTGDTYINPHGIYFYFVLEQQAADGSWVEKDTRYSTAYYTTVPMNYDIVYTDINFGTLEYGTYRLVLKTQDRITKEFTTQDDRYIFNIVNAYFVWTSQGTRSTVKDNNEVITIDKDAAAVDLSSYSFSDVEPNANPNTLYYLSDSQRVPASLEGKNVVQGLEANSITLTDGHGFYVPFSFIAQDINYSRVFNRGLTSGADGWSTIVLPFAVSQVTANGSPISRLRNAEDEQGRYWLMEYVSDDKSHVEFNYADSFDAYCPYLIAVPGKEFGDQSLEGQELTFSASGNVLVSTSRKAVRNSGNFKLCGSMEEAAKFNNIYVLNDDGSNFIFQNTATMNPFQAYLQSLTNDDALGIGLRFTEPIFSGINNVYPSPFTLHPSSVFDLQGRRVGQPKSGFYIVNGKKYITK